MILKVLSEHWELLIYSTLFPIALFMGLRGYLLWSWRYTWPEYEEFHLHFKMVGTVISSTRIGFERIKIVFDQCPHLSFFVDDTSGDFSMFGVDHRTRFRLCVNKDKKFYLHQAYTDLTRPIYSILDCRDNVVPIGPDTVYQPK